MVAVVAVLEACLARHVSPSMSCEACLPSLDAQYSMQKKEEGTRKREEGRGKKEEGRGKKEEGRIKHQRPEIGMQACGT